MAHRIAELQYSEDYGRVELIVPKGTKLATVNKLKDKLFRKDFVARLPRGCQQCLSGEPFIIRERLENVLRIDLEKMEIVDEIQH